MRMARREENLKTHPTKSTCCSPHYLQVFPSLPPPIPHPTRVRKTRSVDEEERGICLRVFCEVVGGVGEILCIMWNISRCLYAKPPSVIRLAPLTHYSQCY
ncbi:hypothetical protein CHARACLAT_016348 [Characodon lateralis]|uniref:Uncharacterized protein n=1 Tax=Characodon lateralis TaxID=208331 RepID=A0ABU7EA65_9TELE|nr:hypothetical protein [Characodon lateralis]